MRPGEKLRAGSKPDCGLKASDSAQRSAKVFLGGATPPPPGRCTAKVDSIVANAFHWSGGGVVTHGFSGPPGPASDGKALSGFESPKGTGLAWFDPVCAAAGRAAAANKTVSADRKRNMALPDRRNNETQMLKSRRL
ncbi:hypothetical protein SAMN02745126_00802 [Enhydrobacter aerosaccus]|uniref:Uncharacterized protein n=1 Tax=Enhydrobacter aerosaccus TaxID=225324 RepID=A0A1T4K8H3_9HYPH|nr:hypothetical protein [Enhydrobacter aerosaccus]SJZ38748.1 hypothetical protein SAMN02745126_00802 [Enhydrobacter aerosaccus]